MIKSDNIMKILSHLGTFDQVFKSGNKTIVRKNGKEMIINEETLEIICDNKLFTDIESAINYFKSNGGR